MGVRGFFVRHAPPRDNIAEEDPSMKAGNPHAGVAWLARACPLIAEAMREVQIDTSYSGLLPRMAETLAGIAAHRLLPEPTYDERFDVRNTYYKGKLYPDVEEPCLQHMENMRSFFSGLEDGTTAFCSTSGGIIGLLMAEAKGISFPDNASATSWVLTTDIRSGDVWEVVYDQPTGKVVEVKPFYRLPV